MNVLMLSIRTFYYFYHHNSMCCTKKKDVGIKVHQVFEEGFRHSFFADMLTARQKFIKDESNRFEAMS